jgi:hypothetical protein
VADTSERTSEEALRPHGASFVRDYLEAEHEGSDRELFLGRVRFRLSELNLSDAAREEVFKWAQTLAERLRIRLVATAAVDEAGQLTQQVAQELRQAPHADVLKKLRNHGPRSSPMKLRDCSAILPARQRTIRGAPCHPKRCCSNCGT